MTISKTHQNILNEANTIIKKVVQEQPKPFANVGRAGLSTTYAFFTAVAPSGTVYEVSAKPSVLTMLDKEKQK